MHRIRLRSILLVTAPLFALALITLQTQLGAQNAPEIVLYAVRRGVIS